MPCLRAVANGPKALRSSWHLACKQDVEVKGDPELYVAKLCRSVELSHRGFMEQYLNLLSRTLHYDSGLESDFVRL